MTTAALKADFKKYLSALSPEGRRAFVPALEWLVSIERHYQAPSRQTAAPARAESVNSESRARIRANLVAEIWEPELRVELVDRIVDAYERGWIDAVSLRSAIRRAQDRRTEYDRTNGAKGKDAVWKTLASWCKGVFETNGYEWTATASALEPRPQKPASRRRVYFADGTTADLDELNEQET